MRLERSRRMAQHRIIAVTGPSGAGKSSITHGVTTLLPQLRFSVSITTRKPRALEQNGKDYHFVSDEEFRQLVSDGKLAEYEEVYPGTFYGTLHTELARASGEQPMLLDIDVKGALRLQASYPGESLTIFIQPPSVEALQARLRQRATESTESMRARLQRAEEEMHYVNVFNAVVVNNSLERAVAETADLIRSFLGTQ